MQPGSQHISIGLLAGSCCLGLVWLAGGFVNASRQLSFSDTLLAEWGVAQGRLAVDGSNEERLHLVEELYQRVAFYEQQIQIGHLVNGMVVSRHLEDGRMLDQCDSLLFSSLRYTALLKLGLSKEAHQAWTAISASQNQGNWPRHPTCVHPTSRDMILGLMIALSQQPQGSLYYLRKILWVIGQQNGYFSHGNPTVSFLSPSLAENIRQIAVSRGLHDYEIPLPVQLSFSTLEFDSLFLEKGYKAHLLALQVWLEMENQQRLRQQGQQQAARSVLVGLAPALAPLTFESVYEQRLRWVSSQLVALDPPNLFFRWLRLKSAGHLSPALRLQLIRELLAMPQFPSKRLPQNCDRKADYLWQRNSREFQALTDHCSMQFPGVDFLWMASLLVEGDGDAAFLPP